MIDALLFAVRNALYGPDFAYAPQNCDIRADAMPPPNCGDFFLSIHEAGSQSLMDNALDEYFAFDLTLTYRITIPGDRLGDRELASKLSRQKGPAGSLSLNERCEALRAYFHMPWGVIGDANTLIAQWTPGNATVYGFAEPPRYRGMELPRFESGVWFGAEPDSDLVGLIGQLHFGYCRRLQAIATFA